MVNYFKAGGRILSNGDARGFLEGLPLLKNLPTKGEGIGAKSAWGSVKGARGDIKHAEASISAANGAANKEMSSLRSAIANETDPMKVAELENDLKMAEAAHAGNLQRHTKQLEAGYDQMAGGIMDLVKTPLRYFGASDMKGMQGRAMVAGTRIGVGAGVYMGGAAGLRYMSGGGLTYNNAGEQDIAGIPFI